MTTPKISPRPQHGDVVIERDDQPTVLVVVRHRTGAPDAAGEALSLARRIARLEAVAEAMRCMRRAYNSERGYGRSLHAAFIALDALDATEADR